MAMGAIHGDVFFCHQKIAQISLTTSPSPSPPEAP